MNPPSLRRLPPVKREKVYEKSALEPPVPHPWPMFSVVVCTFNRAELLTLCLDTLVRQQLSPQHYEILVVDNNSSDHTREVVAGFAATHGHVRYVFELEQGLSAARNRGAKEAVGRYLAYLDDECKVPPDWLSQASRVAAETAARIFGEGPVFGHWGRSGPSLFTHCAAEGQTVESLDALMCRLLRNTERRGRPQALLRT